MDRKLWPRKLALIALALASSTALGSVCLSHIIRGLQDGTLSDKPVTVNRIKKIYDLHDPLTDFAGAMGSPAGRVFLGIEDSSHFYLIVDGKRYSGGVIGRTKLKETSSFNPGLLIEFKVREKETVRHIVDYFSENGNAISISCVHTACKTLEKGGGIRIGKGASPVQSMSQVLKDLAQGHVYDRDGKQVPIVIYATHDLTLREIYQELVVNQAEIMKTRAKDFARPALKVMVVVGGGTVVLLTASHLLDEKKKDKKENAPGPSP